MQNQRPSNRQVHRCFACRAERVAINVEQIARRYDLHTLECPNCLSIVRMVEPRKGKNFYEEARDVVRGYADQQRKIIARLRKRKGDCGQQP